MPDDVTSLRPFFRNVAIPECSYKESIVSVSTAVVYIYKLYLWPEGRTMSLGPCSL